MSEHTPGPWKAINATVYCEPVGPAFFGSPIPYESGWVDGAWENDQKAHANARLIAAAPDMLEALHLVLDTYGFDGSTDSAIWKTVCAAIAKATGDAP